MESVQLDVKVTAAVSQNNLIIKVTGSQILKHFQTARVIQFSTSCTI